MNRIGTFVIAISLATIGMAAFACSSGAGNENSSAGKDNVTAQILVRFKDGTTEVEAAKIIQRIGAQEIDRLMDGKIYLVEIPYPSSQTDIINALSATEGVVYAEPNQVVGIPEPPTGNEAGDGQSEIIPLPKVD